MGILSNILNAFKGLVSSVRGAFNNDPRYQQNFEWYPGSGGGGGDVTKAYVDQQDAALARRIDGNSTDIDDILLHLTTLDTEVDNLDNDKADKENTYTKTETDSLLDNKADKATTLLGYGITNAYTKTETDSLLDNKADKATTLSGYGITDAYKKTEVDTELDKKLDKRTTGVEVYSHSNATQGAFTVKTSMSSSPTDTNMLTEKAVKDYIDSKGINWNYVGILSASSGSVLNVKDDWTELLLAIRVSEGSAYYNLTNVLPKDGFTRGNPNGNQTFAGFFWNESYNAKIRVGLEGSGDSRNLKLNFSQAVGWGINGIYVLKR